MSIADVAARLGIPMTPLVSAVDDRPPTIGPGWSVYERAPADSSYWPRGGVVVDVVPHGAPVPDTGELVDRYVLVRADKGRVAWLSLRADQLAAAATSRPNARTIRGVCEVAARELARPNRRKIDERHDLELWSLGARLMSVIGAPGSVAP